MPEFYARYKRITTVVELVDVKITADDVNDAREKMTDLIEDVNGGAVNSVGVTLEEVIEDACWEHDADGDGWTQITDPEEAPITYMGEKTDPINLDNFHLEED